MIGQIIILAVGWAGFGTGIVFFILSRRRSRKLMENLEQMLDVAMNGNFLEQNYDESVLSLLETKMAHYLAASEVSSKNLATEKNKIKELIADISHQTKTPISNILLYTELLEEKELTEESKICVTQLHNQADKLSFLIQSMVKSSRLEAGILELHPKYQEIGTVLKAVEEQTKATADKRGITLVFPNSMENSDEQNVKVCIDKKWTVEALFNIVDNALKYTSTGGQVTISTTTTDMFLRVDIADNGMGIAEAEQAQIFKRFYRSLRVSEEEGVGIGLFLAREIIMQEEGYIKLKSRLEVGSTFSVYLKK